MEVNYDPVAAAERHYARPALCDHCDAELRDEMDTVLCRSGQFHEHCYVALFVRPCADCGAEFDTRTEGSEMVEGEPRCWKCICTLIEQTPEPCDCDEDAPCIYHQAQHALEHGRADGVVT